MGSGLRSASQNGAALYWFSIGVRSMPRPQVARIILLSSAALLLPAGCGNRPGERTAVSESRKWFPEGSNAILITVDTLRADHLEPYGYAGVKTPAINKLAADGVV